MGLFSTLLDRVLHIQLYGNISNKMAQRLNDGLKGKGFYNVQLIAVSINSQGGSIVQAKNIASILKKFSHKTSAPVYTFIEDACLSSANIIHTSGNKTFTNEHSLIGEFGYTIKQFGYQNFIKEWNIKQEYITIGKNKVRLDKFKDLKPEDVKWINNILLEWEYELKSQIISNRAQRFSDLKIKNESLETDIFQKTLISPENATKIGLVDGIKSLDQLLEERYHGVKVVDVMKGGFFGEGPKSESNGNPTIEVLNQRFLHQ